MLTPVSPMFLCLMLVSADVTLAVVIRRIQCYLAHASLLFMNIYFWSP